jgi:MFS family permease
MGYLTDILSRKWLFFISALIWNLSTAAAYFCHSFYEILLTRIISAAFIAGCDPVSISLINSYFGHTNVLSRANSIYNFGMYLGSGISSLTLFLDKSYGWRMSVLIVCGISSLFQILMVAMEEPVKG